MLALTLTAALALQAGAAGLSQLQQPRAGARPAAPAALDTAIARMGGRALLEGIQRVRLEMVTQWLRSGFDRTPGADQPSYELHSDLRDYSVPAWRNTRRFLGGPGVTGREVVDVVRDSVGARRTQQAAGAEPGWTPLNLAYVDERRELFAFAPERVLLLAARDPRARALRDTLIAKVAYARVAATIDGFATTLLLDRGTGLLASAHFRAAHPNDFGLAPWGPMAVELWYANWRRQRNELTYPTQWDTHRAGSPYKRMTVLNADFDAPAPADSFAISDSLRDAFLRTQRRAMHDLPLDSARIVGGRLASFGAFGVPYGAVKLDGRWVLLEAGQAPFVAERAAAWLARADSGSSIAAALVTVPAAASGGVAWLAERRIPIHAARGARPFVDAMLANHGLVAPQRAMVTTVTAGKWLRVGRDSLWMEPIDLPNNRGTLLVYVPSLRWAYAATLTGPLELERVLARARERGWTVERVGARRGMTLPVPAAPGAPGTTSSTRQPD